MNDSARHYSHLDHAYHLHSFTDLHKYEEQQSVVIQKGEGIYLVDSDGKRYLDAMSSLWCATLGYSEDRLVKAAQNQLSILPYSHTFRGRSSNKLVDLAEKIIEISPNHLVKVYFAGSGSEANESAIKIAWSYHKFNGDPEKRRIISRTNGYHGSTIFATRLSGMPPMHQYLNTDLPDVIYADFPHYSTEALENESESEFASRLANQLEDQILEYGPETIAAFIAEPVMGVGGVIVPPDSYFEKIQVILDRYDILFIADEVICGFGRTGDMFGSTTFNIKPDILTAAKGISSAYFPISAVLITEEIHDVLIQSSVQKGVFSHGFTYSGHPVGAAVALETIAILEERDILNHVRTVGRKIQSEIQNLCQMDLVTNVRGVGLMAGFDLIADKKNNVSFDPNLSVGTKLMDIAEHHGLFVRAVGDTIVMAPPLIITEDEIDELARRLTVSLLETDAAVRNS